MTPATVQAEPEITGAANGAAARPRSPLWHPDIPTEVIPNIDDLVIQDDKPVDGIQTERNMRLLTEPLHTSWAGPGDGRTFIALANVGIFFAVRVPPIVPDVLLSLDVTWGGDLNVKENQSYFVWIVGKVPDVAIEIVSNLEGGKGDRKLVEYARLRIPYYVIFDPRNLLKAGVLRVFDLPGRKYRLMDRNWLEDVGLGLVLWQGKHEEVSGTWLRWCDRDGKLIPTGQEARDAEREHADKEKERADREQERADAAERNNRALVEKLRALGIEGKQ